MKPKEGLFLLLGLFPLPFTHREEVTVIFQERLQEETFIPTKNDL
jgi:hypothetical protein